MPAYKRADAWGDQWHYRKLVTLPDGTKQRIAGTPAVNTKKAAEQAESAHVERVLNPDGVQFDADMSGNCDGCSKQYRGDIRFLDGGYRTVAAGMSVYVERLPGQRKRWHLCLLCWRRIEVLVGNGTIKRPRGRIPSIADDVIVEDDFPERMDAHVVRMRTKYPGIRFTRKEAARSLLHKALRAEEQQTKKTG